MFLGANSSRPTGSLRQRPKTRAAARKELLMHHDKEKQQNS
jgi:hypothetical protein